MTAPVATPDISGPTLEPRPSQAERYEKTHGPTSARSYFARSQWRFMIRPERTDDGWIVTEEVTGIFGVGERVEDAMKDLRLALKEHRAVLAADPNLAPGLQEQLSYLNARLPQQS